MSLRINNNIPSLRAQRHLEVNDRQLSKSLEKLSSGIDINSGADGPASLVISENMRAQIGGLEQAIDNNASAVSLVQTAEGALNEVSRLLNQVRQRAIHAANEGINNDAMLDADQAEIENALAAIDRIAQTTQFGQRKLLDGSRAVNGSTTGQGVSFVSASSATESTEDGGFDVVIFEEAKKASFTGSKGLTKEMIASGETLTIQENGKVATYTTNKEDTIKSAIDGLAAAADRAGLEVNVLGSDDGQITIEHNEFGSAQQFQVNSTTSGVLSNEQGQEVKVENGVDVRGTINGESAEGNGEYLTGRRGNRTTSDLVVKYEGSPDVQIDSAEGTNVGQVQVNQNSLTFHVGANQGQTVSISLLDVSSTQIARDIDNGSGFNSLADVDVRDMQGAQDTIMMVDQAIEEISSDRGFLGAFQKNTLESNLSSLQIASENLIAAESTIRDTDMAKELATFTKNQILSQSATAQLAQANNAPHNVMRLLGV